MKNIGVDSLMFFIWQHLCCLSAFRCSFQISGTLQLAQAKNLLYGWFESEQTHKKLSRKFAIWKNSRVRQPFKFRLNAIFSPQLNSQVLSWYK